MGVQVKCRDCAPCHGGGCLTRDELTSDFSYLTVFITHFLGNPADNSSILRKLYLDFNLSTGQIAEITNWGRTTITDALKTLNIKKETNKATHPKFGERIIGNLMVSHQGEQLIIKKIMTLKDQGKSYSEIVNYLNNENIPAKYGGKWHKTSVQNIVERKRKEEKCKQ